ncbi:MAG: hypothetical protein BRD45_06825 [Bacteroidetes bacterium QS_8_64_10]|nr:MAG: hypothetical protein BRD45_06825 [Bacteroidetes bacterium QS_8_64_10]
MLAPPFQGIAVSDLADQNLVQGIDGGDYPNAAPNLYTGYNVDATGTSTTGEGCQDSNADDRYVCPSSSYTLPSGKGFIWYIYEEAKVSETDTLAFTWTPQGTERTSDVTVDLVDANQNFYLLGNPYNSNYDLSGLNLDQDGGDGNLDFSQVVQIWDPNGPGTDGNGNSGTYVMRTKSATNTSNFFFEDFSDESLGDISGTDNSGNSVTWDTTLSSATDLSASSDYFEVSKRKGNNRFVGRDLDGPAIWETDNIDLSNVSSDVRFSLDAIEEGDLESSDSLKVQYSTDGGSTFTLAEKLTGDFDARTITVEQLSVDDLIIRVTMDNSAGSEYLTLDNVIATRDGADRLAMGQGFFVERNPNDTDDPTQLTFSESARITNGVSFFGKRARTSAAQPRMISFRLVGRSGGEAVTRDEAIGLYFHPQAQAGPDAWEVSKLTPLATPYAALAFDRNDGDRLLAQAALPHDLSEKTTLPMRVQTYGNAGDQFTLAWPRLDNIPATWTLTLEDTKTNETVNLHKSEQYVFDAATGSKASANQTQDGAPAPLPKAQRMTAPASKNASESRFLLTVDPAGSVDAEAPAHLGPQALAFVGAAPNPVAGRATIRYALPEARTVTVTIYDALGRRAATPVSGKQQTSGPKRLRFDASELAAGVYVVRVRAGAETTTGKLVVTR